MMLLICKGIGKDNDRRSIQITARWRSRLLG